MGGRRTLAKQSARNEFAFKRALVEARNEAGLSQTDLARRMDVNRSTISRFEKIDSDPRLSEIVEYAMHVGRVVEMRLQGSTPIADHDGNDLALAGLNEQLFVASVLADAAAATYRLALPASEQVIGLMHGFLDAVERTRDEVGARAAVAPSTGVVRYLLNAWMALSENYVAVTRQSAAALDLDPYATSVALVDALAIVEQLRHARISDPDLGARTAALLRACDAAAATLRKRSAIRQTSDDYILAIRRSDLAVRELDPDNPASLRAFATAVDDYAGASERLVEFAENAIAALPDDGTFFEMTFDQLESTESHHAEWMEFLTPLAQHLPAVADEINAVLAVLAATIQRSRSLRRRIARERLTTRTVGVFWEDVTRFDPAELRVVESVEASA